MAKNFFFGFCLHSTYIKFIDAATMMATAATSDAAKKGVTATATALKCDAAALWREEQLSKCLSQAAMASALSPARRK